MHLSKEHPTIPIAELRAVLKGRILETADALVLIECTDPKALNSLAFTHEIGKVIFEGSPKELEKIELKASKKSFKVRVKGNPKLEREIGWLVNKKTKAPVDLNAPKEIFLGFMFGKRFILSKQVFKRKREGFEQRKVKYRPFFHPTSMHPKYCRAMINLSGVRKGRVLDPFAGTGGMLIESAMLGNDTYGSDISETMALGAKQNLAHAGLDAKVKVADARGLSGYFRIKFDAIVTDPPYGRSSTLKGESLQSLYAKFLREALLVLKNRARLVIVAPEEVDLEKMAKGYKIEQKHFQRVHKSLCRNFFVLRKKDKGRGVKKKG